MKFLAAKLRNALVAGALIALSLPPWGWWPLAFVGVALYANTTRDNSLGARQHFALGTVFAISWFLPGMAWMWFLTAPGYAIAVLLYASMHGVAAAVSSRSSRREVLAPLLHTLAESLRFSFPFGGVPLASIAIGQAASPFANLARLGGVLLITWFVFRVGFLFSRQAQRRRPRKLAAAVALVIAAMLAPHGSNTGETLRVAAVQGGGPQGTLATNTNSRDVVERHLAATRAIRLGDRIDVVIWPENVIDVASFATSSELSEITAEAQRLNAQFVVGLTESVGDSHFINAQVVVNTLGIVTDRYDKVRRVPFGEYMPYRDLLESLGAPVNLVPRDALAGTGRGRLDLLGLNQPGSNLINGNVRLSVVISWEVFFSGRAHEGVQDGAQLIINPTNGSSYRGTILQTQQVASSRLRAIENGRWLVQVSPTGFSAIVGPRGDVHERTGVSERKVVTYDVPLRFGDTIYSRLGDRIIILFLLAIVAILLLADRRRKPV